MPRLIVASIPGSGSRMLAAALREASGLEHCNTDAQDWTGKLLHTHQTYKDLSKSCNVTKAVFVYAHIGDSICSMYEQRIANFQGLKLMNVRPGHIAQFRDTVDTDPLGAWLYLINGDKLRLREMVLSWLAAPNTLPICYELLCNYTAGTRALLSAFVGYNVQFPEIRPRRSNWLRLPDQLRDAITEQYYDLMVLPEMARSHGTMLKWFEEMRNKWQ